MIKYLQRAANYVKKHKRVFVPFIVVLALLAGWLTFYNTAIAGDMPSRLTVAGQPVNSSSVPDLHKDLESKLSKVSITITDDKSAISRTYKSNDLGLSISKAATEAWKFKPGLGLERLTGNSSAHDLPIKVDADRMKAALADFNASSEYKAPADAKFAYANNQLGIEPAQNGYGISQQAIEKRLKQQLATKINNTQIQASFSELPAEVTGGQLSKLKPEANEILGREYSISADASTETLAPEQIISLMQPKIQSKKAVLTIDQERTKALVATIAAKYAVAARDQIKSAYKSGKPTAVTTTGAAGRAVNNTDAISHELYNNLEAAKNYTGTFTFQPVAFTEKTITVDDTVKTRTVTYSVTVWGNVKSDFETFKTLSHQTLTSSSGWAGAGITFVQVASGGSFTLVLAEPARVAAASSVCDSYYSCRVGRNVIINDDRWAGATSAWTGSLRDYRHMVVNHETGHWLGFGHAHCGGSGQLAPVMQQQSISLQGCQFNPWPLPSEISRARR